MDVNIVSYSVAGLGIMGVNANLVTASTGFANRKFVATKQEQNLHLFPEIDLIDLYCKL